MKLKTFAASAALALALVPLGGAALGAEDLEIGGPCADRDHKVVVTNPQSGDKVKVCFDTPRLGPR